MNPFSLLLSRAAQVCKAFIAHPFLWLGVFASHLAIFPLGYCILNFLVAETPAEAMRLGDPPIPSTWEAGVMNHGQYIRWFSIEAHPLIFWSLVGLLFTNFFLIYYLRKKAAASI